MISIPELRGRKAQKSLVKISGTSQAIYEEDIFKEFLIRIFWMRHPDRGIAKAIMQGLREHGFSKPVTKRKLRFGASTLFLTQLYAKTPGVITLYREAKKDTSFLALQQKANPDNFAVFLRKKDGIYLFTSGGKELLVPSRSAGYFRNQLAAWVADNQVIPCPLPLPLNRAVSPLKHYLIVGVETHACRAKAAALLAGTQFCILWARH